MTNPLEWWKANNARLKKLFVSYGWFAVATYGGVYVSTLAGLFALVRLGAIGSPVDVGSVLDAWSIKKALLGDEPLNLNPAVSDFLVAWLLTKTTEPLRLVTTIAIVPFLVRHTNPAILRFLRVPPDMWHPRFPPLRLRRPRRSESVSGPVSTAATKSTDIENRGWAEIVATVERLATHRSSSLEGGRVGRAARAVAARSMHRIQFGHKSGLQAASAAAFSDGQAGRRTGKTCDSAT